MGGSTPNLTESNTFVSTYITVQLRNEIDILEYTFTSLGSKFCPGYS